MQTQELQRRLSYATTQRRKSTVNVGASIVSTPVPTTPVTPKGKISSISSYQVRAFYWTSGRTTEKHEINAVSCGGDVTFRDLDSASLSSKPQVKGDQYAFDMPLSLCDSLGMARPVRPTGQNDGAKTHGKPLLTAISFKMPKGFVKPESQGAQTCFTQDDGFSTVSMPKSILKDLELKKSTNEPKPNHVQISSLIATSQSKQSDQQKVQWQAFTMKTPSKKQMSCQNVSSASVVQSRRCALGASLIQSSHKADVRDDIGSILKIAKKRMKSIDKPCSLVKSSRQQTLTPKHGTFKLRTSVDEDSEPKTFDITQHLLADYERRLENPKYPVKHKQN